MTTRSRLAVLSTLVVALGGTALRADATPLPRHASRMCTIQCDPNYYPGCILCRGSCDENGNYGCVYVCGGTCGMT